MEFLFALLRRRFAGGAEFEWGNGGGGGSIVGVEAQVQEMLIDTFDINILYVLTQCGNKRIWVMLVLRFVRM